MEHYERNEYEDWDEYEEDGEEQEQNEVGEDEYEEETHQPTQEELDYLELRQRLKESIRKKMKKELGITDAGSRDRINGFSKDNYGTFFGPRHPSISQRVIQESKSLLENPDLAARIINPNCKNKITVAAPLKSKSRDNHDHLPRVTNGLKKKVEILKSTRDYSFLLSEDAEVPDTVKSFPPKTVTAPKNDAYMAQQLSSRSNKQVVNDRGRELTTNGRDIRRPLPSSSQNKPKMGQERKKPPTKPAMDPQKQLGSSNGSGPGRPVGAQGMTSRSPAPMTANKASTATLKSMDGGMHRAAPAVVQSSSRKPAPSNIQSGIYKSSPTCAQPSLISRKPSVQQECHRSSKPKVMTKQAVSSFSRDQLRRAPPKAPSRHSFADKRSKAKPKRPLDGDDDENAIDMIRSMFRYDPNKFRDDDDDSDMEAGFEDIMREEKHSAKIGRQEDDEELRLEEEERRRKLAKKRKKAFADVQSLGSTCSNKLLSQVSLVQCNMNIWRAWFLYRALDEVFNGDLPSAGTFFFLF